MQQLSLVYEALKSNDVIVLTESEGDEEPEKRSSEDAGQAEDEKEAGNNPKDEL